MNYNRHKKSSAEKAVNREILTNNELESRQKLFGRESCEWRHFLHVGLGGGNLNNELESRQELFGREGCESRNTIAC